jgi:hypothetical protein
MARRNCGILADQLPVVGMAGDDGTVVDHRIAVSPLSASDATSPSKWLGSTPRWQTDDLVLAADDLARKHRGQTFVTLLTGSRSVGRRLSDMNSR